jgi:hypothetical protein
MVGQDGVADAFRIIVEGSVEIHHGNGSSTILVDGECFGYSWALGASIEADAAGARAMSNVECIAVNDTDVQAILQKQPTQGVNWAPLPSKLQGRPSTPCHVYLPQQSVEERPATPYQLVPMSGTLDGSFHCESPEIRSRPSSPNTRSPRPMVPVPANMWAAPVDKVLNQDGRVSQEWEVKPPPTPVTPPRSGSMRVRKHRLQKLPARPQLVQEEALHGICTSTWPPSRAGEVSSTWVGDHFPMPPTKPKNAIVRRKLAPLDPESRACTID